MTQQTINLGASPNDGTGDGLRTAFAKANANAAELYARFSAPYLGQVATACRVCTQQTNSNKQAMSRSPHTARDAIAALKIVLPTWYMNTSHQEYGVGGAVTFTASIEYPAGVFAQVTFGGAPAATVPDATQVVSDFVTVAIPSGARFWVRTFQQYANPSASAGGIVYWDQVDFANGAAYAFAPSGLSDQTMGGAIANSNTSIAAGFGPVAILAMTAKPSVLLVGDSRCDGQFDAFDGTGDLGELARSIGPSLAYINSAQSGDTAAGYISQAATARLRIFLAQYCTHVVCQMGINDVDAAIAIPTLRVNMSALWRLFPNKKVWQATIAPNSTSTDSFATLANQTPVATDATRVMLNDWIRTAPDVLAGYFELADAVESGRNSGRWKANGTANYYTHEGLHEAPAGYQLIVASGAINPSSLIR